MDKGYMDLGSDKWGLHPISTTVEFCRALGKSLNLSGAQGFFTSEIGILLSVQL